MTAIHARRTLSVNEGCGQVERGERRKTRKGRGFQCTCILHYLHARITERLDGFFEDTLDEKTNTDL